MKISRTCLAYIMQSDVNDLWKVSVRSLCSVFLHAALSIVPWWQLLGLEAGIEPSLSWGIAFKSRHGRRVHWLRNFSLFPSTPPAKC